MELVDALDLCPSAQLGRPSSNLGTGTIYRKKEAPLFDHLATVDSQASLLALDEDRTTIEDFLLVLDTTNSLTEKMLTKRAKRAVASTLNIRGIRVLFEALWESPRRRGDALIGNKYASGSPWSTLAHTRLEDTTTERSLVLEHVVPMKNVLSIIRHMGERGMSIEERLEAIHGLVRHMVITREDDTHLPSTMNSDQEDALLDHYTKINPLDENTLCEARWVRYLSTPQGTEILNSARPLAR